MVFIVGTHIDQLDSEVNSVFDEVIREQNFLDLVCYADGGLKKVMYLVDNTCDEDHNFQILRSTINTFISDKSKLL